MKNPTEKYSYNVWGNSGVRLQIMVLEKFIYFGAV